MRRVGVMAQHLPQSRCGVTLTTPPPARPPLSFGGFGLGRQAAGCSPAPPQPLSHTVRPMYPFRHTDVESKALARRTCQHAVADAMQEASRTEGGANGPLFWSSAAGERASLAPASQLEGLVALNMPACPSLPAHIAFPNPLFHTVDSAVDSSLHRSLIDA